MVLSIRTYSVLGYECCSCKRDNLHFDILYFYSTVLDTIMLRNNRPIAIPNSILDIAGFYLECNFGRGGGGGLEAKVCGPRVVKGSMGMPPRKFCGLGQLRSIAMQSEKQLITFLNQCLYTLYLISLIFLYSIFLAANGNILGEKLECLGGGGGGGGSFHPAPPVD